MRDAGEQLGRLLLARAGDGARIVEARSKAWMSLTLDGRRHRFVLAMPAAAIAPFRDGIEEADFAMRGGILADLVAETQGEMVRVDALTISD